MSVFFTGVCALQHPTRPRPHLPARPSRGRSDSRLAHPGPPRAVAPTTLRPAVRSQVYGSPCYPEVACHSPANAPTALSAVHWSARSPLGMHATAGLLFPLQLHYWQDV